MPSITRFAEYSIDPATGTIAGPNGNVHIEPKNMDVLMVLLKANGELVSREKILQQVWPNQQVSDDVINTAISMLRKALVQSGPSNKYLLTVPRKGYRLVYPASDNVMTLHPKLKNKTQQVINAPFLKSEPTQASKVDEPQPLDKTEQPELSLVNRHDPVSADIVQQKKSPLIPRARWLIGLLVCIGIMLVIPLSYQSWQKQQLEKTILTLHTLQKRSYESFIIQAKRRNELVSMVEARLDIKRNEQYEKFFAKYQPQMNSEELFVFDQIRGITRGALLSANSSMLRLLDDNPKLVSHFPLVEDLHKHLAFWLSKYHNVFALRDDMCLLYVGVEDGVPYPSDLDTQIKQWLEQRALISISY